MSQATDPATQRAFGLALKKLMEDGTLLGGSREAVADFLDVDPTMVSHYTAGRRIPRADRIAAIAREAGVATDYLLGLSPTPRPEPVVREVIKEVVVERLIPDPPKDWEGFARVPGALETVRAGYPALSDPRDKVRHYVFHSGFLRQLLRDREHEGDPARLRCWIVEGDSMRPTIEPGAVLLVDRWPKGAGPERVEDIQPGAIHVVAPIGLRGQGPEDRGLTVKRVHVLGDEIVLTSDNPAYGPMAFRPGEDTPLRRIIVGRVRWVGHIPDGGARRARRGHKGDLEALVEAKGAKVVK